MTNRKSFRKIAGLSRLLRNPPGEACHARELLERGKGGHHGQSPSLTETDQGNPRGGSAGAYFVHDKILDGGYRRSYAGFVVAVARREVRNVEPARSALTLVVRNRSARANER